MVDVLGILTIAVYGSWYYGFGVVIDDIGADLNMSATQLGLAFGAAQLLLGVLSIGAGRLLDRYGPGLVLGLIGPLGAIVLGFAGRAAAPWQFLVCFGVGGGVTAAAGFYGMTQAILVRLDREQATRRIIRLTIWGALASPIAIPLTEILRRELGWRLAIELPAAGGFVAFLAASRVVRRVPKIPGPLGSTSWLEAIGRAVRDAAIRWHALGVLATYMAMSTLLVFQVSILRWAGLGTGMAAGFAGARGMMQLAGRLPLSGALRRWSVWRLLAGARLAVAAACGVILVSGHPAVAVLYVVLAGTGIGAISALDGILAREVLPEGDYGSLSGVLTLLGALGGAAAPVVAGRVTDLSGSPAIASMVAGAAALAAILALGRCHRAWFDREELASRAPMS